MTTLVVDELRSTLTQTFTYNLHKRASIAGVRPYLLMFNSPAGTFTITLKDNGGNTLASKNFTSTEIKSDMSTAHDYVYLWKALTFDTPVQIVKGTYSLVLSSSGYGYAVGSFLGWIKEHENQFNADDGTSTGYEDIPFSYQLFSYKENVE